MVEHYITIIIRKIENEKLFVIIFSHNNMAYNIV